MDLRFGNRLCVPIDPEIKRIILEKAHHSPFTVHSGSTKMYHDLCANYWWNGMKRWIARFVEQCLTCQKVNIVLHFTLKLMVRQKGYLDFREYVKSMYPRFQR